jgi:hypothetical protein
VDEYKKILQFQSTLAYLKDPPPTDQFEPVDLLQGLDDIKLTAAAEGYANNYEFEKDLRVLLSRAHDGHLFYSSNCLEGLSLH